jgi:mannosyltransferase OCH1-like enzyme
LIPKIIHYCWFGNPIGSKQLQIIDNWKLLHPDFEFMFWGNELLNNCTIKFVKQAARKKQWAFVADYFRLIKVNEFGGYYLDTDMLLIKRIDKFQDLDFVICDEEKGRPNWGFFGSIKNNFLLESCIQKYTGLNFDQFKPPVIPYFLKEEVNKAIINNPNYKCLISDYFYPMPLEKATEKYQEYVSESTIAVHMWDFSWGKIKKERSLVGEVLYRLNVLFLDFFTFSYRPTYFIENLVRIKRLILVKSNWKN